MKTDSLDRRLPGRGTIFLAQLQSEADRQLRLGVVTRGELCRRLGWYRSDRGQPDLSRLRRLLDRTMCDADTAKALCDALGADPVDMGF